MNKLKKNEKPLVHIVILNYNGFKDTIECISSLLKLTYSNIRITIVDNMSTDESISNMKSFFNENNLHYTHFNVLSEVFNSQYDVNKVTLIEAGTNNGYGHGNNIGIKYALRNEADYVLILNNDTLVSADFVEPLLKVCQDDEFIGVASGRIYFYPEVDRIWYAGGSYSKLTMTTKHFHYKMTNCEKNKKLDVSFISGCLWFIPAHVFNTVGLINENYFMYVEDLEFCHRILAAGFKLKYISDSVIYHKAGASSSRDSEFSVYWTSKNTIRFILENLPKKYVVISIPYYILRKTLSFLKHSNFPALKAHFRGVFFQLTNAINGWFQ